MASQPQPLPPALPCTSPTAAGGAGLAASSPEKGTARPKPLVRPKPRVLPKPAVPAKPSLPQPPPGPRHPRPELPSAEKLNRLAGPQPYSAGGAGGPVRRPSFTIKSPETSNGKGLPSPSAAAAEDSGSIPGEEVPPALLTPPRKSPSPFKVTPVPVATKPERFPGTTVEEILAKMDSREGPGSPDRARLSPFCPDPSPRFGSKTFSAFRRRPSGAADGAPPAEPHQTPQPVAGELGKEHDGHRVAETSSSPPAGPSCAGDPRGCQRPPSPADLSSLQPTELAWAPVGDRPGSLQGPGGPGRAEGPSKGADPHADPGWLTELLASPRAHRTGLGSPNAEGLEDQLSWSPKGLCGDFGAGSPHHGTFSWSCEAVARERDWPGETERDRDPETKPDWGSAHSAGDGDRQDRPFGSTCRDWGSAYQGTELTGETSLGCSDWPESRGTGESCRQDQDFGAGKPQWGSGEESGSGRADWSSGCGLGHGLGHGQQRDREPGSRQHSWAELHTPF
ncbi:hypothetical protein AV530_013595 [Patagioenas fasciata monilis]|uniref:Tankyrase 1-binding protein C-terminal domain-containing protein n=1 Tax=Patagioenas fasciata monilis TaxID=372326 RepID=A0A1V4JPZ8_PATFA|nr:hypothetical protein AV530_013595 [Patagioenas fasciata monilis]